MADQKIEKSKKYINLGDGKLMFCVEGGVADIRTRTLDHDNTDSLCKWLKSKDAENVTQLDITATDIREGRLSTIANCLASKDCQASIKIIMAQFNDSIQAIDLSIFINSGVEIINLAGCGIQKIIPSSAIGCSLKALILDNNKITVFDPNIFSNSQIEFLDLSKNQIKKVIQLTGNNSCPLVSLNLASNHIQNARLKSQGFMHKGMVIEPNESLKFISQLPRLVNLSLAENRKENAYLNVACFVESANLKNLDLSGTHLDASALKIFIKQHAREMTLYIGNAALCAEGKPVIGNNEWLVGNDTLAVKSDEKLKFTFVTSQDKTAGKSAVSHAGRPQLYRMNSTRAVKSDSVSHSGINKSVSPQKKRDTSSASATLSDASKPVSSNANLSPSSATRNRSMSVGGGRQAPVKRSMGKATWENFENFLDEFTQEAKQELQKGDANSEAKPSPQK